MSGASAVLDFFFGNIIGAHSIDSSSSQSREDSPETSSSPFTRGEDEMRGESSTAASGKSSREMYRPGEDASSFRRRGGHATTSGESPRGESGSLGYEEELFGASGSAGGSKSPTGTKSSGVEKNASVPSTPKNNNNNNNNRTNSVNQATVNLMNGIFRTGALGLPYCFKLTGVFLTTALIVVSACATIYTTQCLLFASAVTDAWSYEEVAFRTLGNRGKMLVRICVVALLMGCSVAYVNIVSDIFSGVAGTIVPAGAEPSRGETMVAVVCFGFVPLGTMIRSAKALSSTSAFGIFIVWMFTLSVALVYFFKSSVYPDLYAEHELAGNRAVQTWNSKKSMIVLPVLSFGFAASPIIYPVVQTLKDPTNNRVLSVANKSILISGIAYFTIGLMGYMTFQDSTSGGCVEKFWR